MRSAAHARAPRPSRRRRSGALLAERRRNGKSPQPSPARIPWYRTRVVPKEEDNAPTRWRRAWILVTEDSR
jgi:hypothetical protein